MFAVIINGQCLEEHSIASHVSTIHSSLKEPSPVHTAFLFFLLLMAVWKKVPEKESDMRKQEIFDRQVLADIKRKEKDNQPGLTDGYK